MTSPIDINVQTRAIFNLVPRILSLLREVEKGPWERGWALLSGETKNSFSVASKRNLSIKRNLTSMLEKDIFPTSTLWLLMLSEQGWLEYMLSFSFKTPGPGTYEVTHPNTNRRQMPAYTMNGRNYMPEDTTLKPGPGQHSPEKVNWKREHKTFGCYQLLMISTTYTAACARGNPRLNKFDQNRWKKMQLCCTNPTNVDKVWVAYWQKRKNYTHNILGSDPWNASKSFKLRWGLWVKSWLLEAGGYEGIKTCTSATDE